MSFLAETHLSHEKRCRRKYYTLRIKRNTFWENIHSLRPIPVTSPGSFPNHRNISRQKKMYMFRSHQTLISSLLYFGTTMASSLMSFLAETHLSHEKICRRKYYTLKIKFFQGNIHSLRPILDSSHGSLSYHRNISLSKKNYFFKFRTREAVTPL